MYNTDMPNRAELPSTKKLLVSTLLAAASASVLLISVVMPAEYGLDPTGMGQMLGLKKMGQIKQELAVESLPESAPPVSFDIVKISTPQTTSTPRQASRKDEIVLTLAPGEATEVKMRMNQGARVSYSWKTSGPPVNVDAHGDPLNPPADFYHGYGKEKQITGKEGEIVAAFDGNHGWFWRNRAETKVTITLRTQGEYQSIKKVL
jgi:hypothetical protein